MMDEENEQRDDRRGYTRPYPRVYTRETMRGDRRRKHPAPKEAQPHVMGIQIVVCILSLLVVLALHIAKSPADKTVRQALARVLSSQLNQKELSQQVSQVMKKLQIGMPDVKDVFNSKSVAAAQSSKNAGVVSSTSSAVSQTGSSVSNAGQSSVAASQTALLGEGGADLTVQPTDTRLVPPTSVSLGPYLLSAKPIWPVQGRITSPFGFRIHPITHQQSFHTGMDIAAPKDTPILAALPGVVEQAGQSEDYGNFILLDHGGGVETFYGHCDQLLVGQGTAVKMGDTIAKVGMTGLATGYHLHFEIHVDHIVVNPAQALGVQT